jgi:hypothetical protein
LFEAITRSSILIGEALERVYLIIGGLRINPQRMRSNLDLTCLVACLADSFGGIWHINAYLNPIGPGVFDHPRARPVPETGTGSER